MHTVWVTYKEKHISGGEAESNEAYSNRSPEYRDFILDSVELTSPERGFYFQECGVSFEPNAGKRVYVVVVRYSSGDTFGSSYGHGHIEGVYDSINVAEAIKRLICSSGISNREVYAKLKDIEVSDINDYWPWTGYFEVLQEVEIHRMNIRS